MRLSRTRTTIAALATAAAVVAVTATSLPAGAARYDGKPKEVEGKPVEETSLVSEVKAEDQVRVDPAAEKALAEVQERIAGWVKENGTKYSFGSWVDPKSGQTVVVESDAPRELLQELTSVELVKEGRVKTDVRPAATKDVWHRRDDIQSFWGGAGLSSGGSLCSAGYPVKSSSGYRYMVTAGHCFANGSLVRNESGSQTFGWVTGRALASLGSGPVDMELLYGKSYSGRVYTGGVTSTSSIPIKAAGRAYVGYNDYCHSGRTTGERCGHTAQSITGQVCTQSGCKSPVIVYTGGVLSTNGDSGGAFYAKDSRGAWIRGHVIAGSSSTAYAETYLKVAARYGVSIVTG